MLQDVDVGERSLEAYRSIVPEEILVAVLQLIEGLHLNANSLRWRGLRTVALAGAPDE